MGTPSRFSRTRPTHGQTLLYVGLVLLSLCALHLLDNVYAFGRTGYSLDDHSRKYQKYFAEMVFTDAARCLVIMCLWLASCLWCGFRDLVQFRPIDLTAFLATAAFVVVDTMVVVLYFGYAISTLSGTPSP